MEDKSVQKRGGGQRKAYEDADAIRIINFAMKNRDVSARSIALNLVINPNKLSHDTINRILNTAGLKARRTIEKPLLTPKKKEDRFVFATRHRVLTVE